MSQPALQYVINYLSNVIRDRSFYDYMSQNNFNNEAIRYLSQFENNQQNMAQAISNLFAQFNQQMNQQRMPQNNMYQNNGYQQGMGMQQNNMYQNNGYQQGMGMQQNMGFQQGMGIQQVDTSFNRHVEEHKANQPVVVQQTVMNEPVQQATINSNNGISLLTAPANVQSIHYTKEYLFERDKKKVIVENVGGALSMMLEKAEAHDCIVVQPVTIFKTRKGFGSKQLINSLIDVKNDNIDNFFTTLTTLTKDYPKVFNEVCDLALNWVNNNYKYITGDLSEGANVQEFNDINDLREFIGVIPRQDSFKEKLTFNKRLTSLLENIRALYFNFNNGNVETENDIPLLLDYDKDIIVTSTTCDLYYSEDIDYEMLSAIATDIYKNNKLFGFIATRDDVSELVINKNKEGKLESYKLRQIYRL